MDEENLITFEQRAGGERVFVELASAAPFAEVAGAFRRFALAAGYQPDTVDQYIKLD